MLYYRNILINIIEFTTKDIVFCVDESKTTILNKLIENNSCSVSFSDCTNWMKYLKELQISNPNIDSCLNTSYLYEYLGKCYAKCSFKNFVSYDCIEIGKCPDLTSTEFKNKINGKIISYVNSSKVINGSNFLTMILSSEEIF